MDTYEELVQRTLVGHLPVMTMDRWEHARTLIADLIRGEVNKANNHAQAVIFQVERRAQQEKDARA